jgi:hypothetical protein
MICPLCPSRSHWSMLPRLTLCAEEAKAGAQPALTFLRPVRAAGERWPLPHGKLGQLPGRFAPSQRRVVAVSVLPSMAIVMWGNWLRRATPLVLVEEPVRFVEAVKWRTERGEGDGVPAEAREGWSARCS